MRDFRTFIEESLLAERALDAEMTSAANESFSRLKAHLVKSVRRSYESWLAFVPGGSGRAALEAEIGFTIPKPQTDDPLEWTNPSGSAGGITKDQFETLRSQLANRYFTTLHIEGDVWPSSTKVPGGTGRAATVRSSSTSPSILVFPPSIPKGSLGRMTVSSEIVIHLISGTGGAGAFFRDPRRSFSRDVHGKATAVPLTRATGDPTIGLLGAGSWRLLPDPSFTCGVEGVALLHAAGLSGAGGMRRLIRNRIEKFDRQIESFRSAYVHEYVHFLDALRHKGNVTSKANVASAIAGSNITAAYAMGLNPFRWDFDAYFRSPAEWNAYYSETVVSCRRILSSYMTSLMSDVSAYAALNLVIRSPEFSGRADAAEAAFNDPKDPSRRNAALAKVVSTMIGRFAESKPHDRRIDTVGNAPIGGRFGGFVLTNLSKGQAEEAFLSWMRDPKLMKRTASRIYSTAQDLEAMASEFVKRVQAGKATPSKAEWERAIASVRQQPSVMQTTDRIVGHIRNSKAPYSPKTAYLKANSPFP